MKKEQEELIKLRMDNPCLSEPIDYEDEDIRLRFYTKWVEMLDEDELRTELEDLKERLA